MLDLTAPSSGGVHEFWIIGCSYGCEACDGCWYSWEDPVIQMLPLELAKDFPARMAPDDAWRGPDGALIIFGSLDDIADWCNYRYAGEERA